MCDFQINICEKSNSSTYWTSLSLFSFSRKSAVFIARVCPDRRGPVSPSHSLPPGARPYLAPDYSLCYPATLSSHWSIHITLAFHWPIPTDTGSQAPAPPSHCKPVHPSLSLSQRPGYLKTRTARAPAVQVVTGYIASAR